MVPVNAPLTLSFGATARQLREHLGARAQCNSPVGGFLRYLCEQVGVPSPIEFVKAEDSAAVADLSTAPSLATMGYSFALPGPPKSLERQRWSASLTRFAKKELFPPDRQTFVHRPVELLGVTLGVMATEQERAWLEECFQALPEHVGNDSWSRMISAWAARLCGCRWPASLENRPTELDDAELSLLICLLALPSPAIFPEWAALDSDKLQHELLQRFVLKLPDETKPERVSAMYVALVLSTQCQLRSVLADRPVHPKHEALVILEKLCRGFDAFARKLAKRHAKRTSFAIRDEYDVQDAMHSLLVLHFELVLPEEHSPSVGGNPARMDFLLKNERIVVELKMTRKSLGQREVFDELIVDRERYRRHPDCYFLVCFLYDPQHLCHNPNVLESDGRKDDAPPFMRVFVCPH